MASSGGDLHTTPVRVRVLRPPALVDDEGVPVALGSRHARQVFAILAMAPGRPVAAEVLVDALWGETPPPSAPGTLQSYISRLRGVLRAVDDATIEHDGAGYRLVVDPSQVDVVRFEQLVDAGRRLADAGEWQAARDALVDAEALWAGEVPVEVADLDVLAGRFVSLRETRLAATELRLRAELELGRHDVVVPELAALVGDHPLREGLHHLLALALYRSNRQADALRSLAEARRLLRDQLGIDPGAELQRLETRVLAQDPALLAPATEHATGDATARIASDGLVIALTGRTRGAGGVPSYQTALVGRAAELEHLDRVVRHGSERLVTVRGPGGIGKTRLVSAWAQELVQEDPSAVTYVPLVALSDAEHLASAVAVALGLMMEGEADPADHVVAALGQRPHVVVLDNLEHLLPDAAVVEWLGELLEACPGVQLVVTSRERLGVPAEHVVELGGLTLPDAVGDPLACEAVELFWRRARQVRASFAAGDELDDVVAICRVLDGMPLGIELAATWVRLLSCAEILEEIRRTVDFLTVDDRGTDTRHQSMRAVLEHSWNLLGEAERLTLARLSVFRGGFDRLAAASVAGASLPQLAALVDRSMIRVRTGAAGATRYDVHELLRQYAAERLAEQGAVEETALRHVDWFVEAAERAHTQLRQAGQIEALAALTADLDNLRTALDWSLAHQRFDLAARLGWALWPFWWVRNLQREGRRWMERLLPHVHQLELGLRTRAVMCIEAMAYGQGDAAACERFAHELVELAAAAGDDPHPLAYAHSGFGLVATVRGDVHAALEHLVTARELLARSGELGMAAQAATWIGTVHLLFGRLDVARRHMTDGLREGTAIGDRLAITNALYNLAWVHLAEDDPGGAAGCLVDSITPSLELDDRGNLVFVFELLAVVAALVGLDEDAAALFGGADGVLEAIGARGHTYHRPDTERIDAIRAAVRAQLGPHRFDEIHSAAHRRSLTELVALARRVGDTALAERLGADS